MKGEVLPLIPQKYKGSWETAVNNNTSQVRQARRNKFPRNIQPIKNES